MAQDPSVLLLWQTFLRENPQTPTDTLFEAWSFGSDAELADELLSFVLEGKKTGTASAYDLYLADDQALPSTPSYSILLDGQGQARCIIETVSVEILAFKDVTAEQAYKEGEGDRTLAHWRKVHQAFWEQEFSDYSVVFSEEMLVVYEEFKVVYK